MSNSTRLTEYDENEISRPSSKFKEGMHVRHIPTGETFRITVLRHKQVGYKLKRDGEDFARLFDVKDIEVVEE